MGRQAIRMDRKDKILKQAIKESFYRVKGVFLMARSPSLRKIKNPTLGHIATISANDLDDFGTENGYRRTWDVYLQRTDGTMQVAHHHAPYSLRFESRKNRADRLDDRATGKWLYEAGTITAEEALIDYGYKV
jgi:hypothetical protein